MLSSKSVAAFFFLVCITGHSALGEDWPRWLGPSGDGVLREKGLVQGIPAEGFKINWRTPIGGGYAGPVVANGKLYVMDFVATEAERESAASGGDPGAASGKAGTERVRCLDATTGDPIWEHSYQTLLTISYAGGPRSCATVDGKKVYALGTMGRMMCLDANSGDVDWTVELTDRYETKPPFWGYATPPLIVDDLLICTVGGEGTGVVAFDKETGEEVWRNLTAQEIGYAPPVLAEFHGKPHLLVWYDVALAALDPSNGSVIWSFKFPMETPKRPIVSIVPPHVAGNRVFLTNYYHGSVLLDVSQEGPVEVWSTEKTKHDDDINSIMSTVLLADGFYYGVSGTGELRCVSAEDAAMSWWDYQALALESEDPKRRPRGLSGFAAMFMVPHGDHTWLFTDQGDLIDAQLSPEGYRERGRTHLLDTTGTTRGRPYVWCPPAFSNGAMFVRNEKELISVDMRADSYQEISSVSGEGG